jgi:hypothetical protein
VLTIQSVARPLRIFVVDDERVIAHTLAQIYGLGQNHQGSRPNVAQGLLVRFIKQAAKCH